VPLPVKSEGSYVFSDGGFGFRDHENLWAGFLDKNKTFILNAGQHGPIGIRAIVQSKDPPYSEKFKVRN